MREVLKVGKDGGQDIRQTRLEHQPDTHGGKKVLPPRGRPPVQHQVAYHSSSIVHAVQPAFNTPACSRGPIL